MDEMKDRKIFLAKAQRRKEIRKRVGNVALVVGHH
jgi:hypothetical protein